MDKSTLVLDNGAYTIKTHVLTAANKTPPPRLVTNAIVRQTKGEKRTFFGHEFKQCKDFASLHFRLPFERGYLTDWDAQKAIWDALFFESDLKFDPSHTSLIVTEPYFNLPNIQDQYDQFIFEEYEFNSYHRCTPASLIPYGTIFRSEHSGCSAPECMLIVDSGYSFTHVVPLIKGQVMWKGVRRVDVGGKLLTNYLKELLSYRQFDLMGETYITNDVKEKCCYVSTNFKGDMERARYESSKIVQDYILPRFSDNKPGRIKMSDETLNADDDVLRMTSERFAVPEVLFRPSDIGMAQAGISDAITSVVHSLPEDLQGLFWANICLIGGNVKFPGFRERLLYELRTLAPVNCEVCIYEPSDPITEAYYSAVNLAQQSDFNSRLVTRSEYQEYGSNACKRKFEGMLWQEKGPEGGEVQEVWNIERDKSRPKARMRSKADAPDPTASRRVVRGTRTHMTSK